MRLILALVFVVVVPKVLVLFHTVHAGESKRPIAQRTPNFSGMERPVYHFFFFIKMEQQKTGAHGWSSVTKICIYGRHQVETFSALLALGAGNSPVPVNSPHKGQWHGALMFSLICAWINDWVNNRQAGDLRRHCCHYDVNVMHDEVLLVCRANKTSRYRHTY